MVYLAAIPIWWCVDELGIIMTGLSTVQIIFNRFLKTAGTFPVHFIAYDLSSSTYRPMAPQAD